MVNNNNNDAVVAIGVSKNDTVNNISDNEDIMGVEVSSDTVGNSGDDESVKLVKVIEGVVVSVHELERERRANFSRGVGGEDMASRV